MSRVVDSEYMTISGSQNFIKPALGDVCNRSIVVPFGRREKDGQGV